MQSRRAARAVRRELAKRQLGLTPAIEKLVPAE